MRRERLRERRGGPDREILLTLILPGYGALAKKVLQEWRLFELFEGRYRFVLFFACWEGVVVLHLRCSLHGFWRCFSLYDIQYSRKMRVCFRVPLVYTLRSLLKIKVYFFPNQFIATLDMCSAHVPTARNSHRVLKLCHQATSVTRRHILPYHSFIISHISASSLA